MSTPRKFFKRKNFGQFVECTEQEYRDWETRCKADPFYATSHAEEYRINYDLDLDDFQDATITLSHGAPPGIGPAPWSAEGVAPQLEPSQCPSCTGSKDMALCADIFHSPKGVRQTDVSPAGVSKNLREELVNANQERVFELLDRAMDAEAKIAELEKEITALRETK